MKNYSTSLKFLFLAPVAFNGLWQRHQAFALELAKLGHEVFYLQPYLSGGFGLFSSFWEGAPQNLRLLRVKVPFKASRWPGLNAIANKLAMRQVVKNMDVKNTILWVAEPYMHLFAQLGFKKILYDRCDLHGSFPGQNSKVWAKYEEFLFDRADLILASHPHLIKTMPSVLGRVMLVPNGVSAEYLAQGKEWKIEDKKSGEALHLLSSGAHFEWTDFNWLKVLISDNGFEVVLHVAGSGRGREFEELIKAPNVIFHKQLSQKELLALIKRCDVGLIPFKDLALIRGVDPIKAYEYASCGLQVWAPKIEALRVNPFVTHFVEVLGEELEFERVVRGEKENALVSWPERLGAVLEALQRG